MDTFNKIKKNSINSINTSIDNLKEKPHLLILPLLLIIIFSIVGYILFSKNIKDLLNKNFVLNREFINKTNDSKNDITVIYFYTDWCPYCKKSKPEWNKFKELIKLQDSNKNIEFKEIDCDKNEQMANKYKIEGYPTIKLIYNGEVYDFDAKPESQTLVEFVQSITS